MGICVSFETIGGARLFNRCQQEGLLVADICTEHQISQAQYYQWRSQFMQKMPQLFANTQRKEKALRRENSRLKKIVGELTLELKKLSEWSE